MITQKQKIHFSKYRRLLKDCSCENENCKHDIILIKWVNKFLKDEIKLKIWKLKIQLENKSYEYK